jgi:hypothetical protein
MAVQMLEEVGGSLRLDIVASEADMHDRVVAVLKRASKSLDACVANLVLADV